MCSFVHSFVMLRNILFFIKLEILTSIETRIYKIVAYIYNNIQERHD